MNGELKIFLSYAHKDKHDRDVFLSHFSSLTKTENISIWTDLEIDPGTKWNAEIERSLNNADLIIFLVSANFISSEYIYKNELAKAFELQEANKLSIIPILLSNVSLTGMLLESLQTLPTDPRFIESWSNRNDAWVNVIEGIRKSIKKIIDNLKRCDPVTARNSILELLKQSEKLEEACNNMIDFASNYSSDEREFEAVTIRTTLSDLEKSIEESSKGNGRLKVSLPDVLNIKRDLRMEIFKLLNAIMSDLSKNATSLNNGK